MTHRNHVRGAFRRHHGTDIGYRQHISLGNFPAWILANVSGCMRSMPLAIATRYVLDFPETSTMRARPASEKWVNPLI